MSGRYAWVRYLPSEALAEFVKELAEACRVQMPLDDFRALIASWEATAEVYSDPELYKRLTTPTDDGDHGPAQPPE